MNSRFLVQALKKSIHGGNRFVPAPHGFIILDIMVTREMIRFRGIVQESGNSPPYRKLVLQFVLMFFVRVPNGTVEFFVVLHKKLGRRRFWVAF